MTKDYNREIGELTRKGRTVYYALIGGMGRDLRQGHLDNRPTYHESHKRADIVALLDKAGAFTF